MGDFLNSFLFLSLGILFGIILGWGIFLESFFTCSESTTTICDYQTLIASFVALFSAIYGAKAIYLQIKKGGENHVRELRLKSLERNLFAKMDVLSTASIINADVKALKDGAEADEYLDSFKGQLDLLSRDPERELEAFYFEQDYLITFHSILPSIGRLSNELAYDISYFYSYLKGYLDTVSIVNQGRYIKRNKIELAKYLYDEMAVLLDMASDLLCKLDLFMKEEKIEIKDIENRIEGLLSLK